MKRNSLANIYCWFGTNAAQQHVCGEDIATSALLLNVTLRRRGINATKIYRKKNRTLSFFNKKVPSHLINDFYQQLASLLSIGIPLIAVLELIAQSYNHASMRTLMANIKNNIENGETLSESLTRYPHYFDLLCCRLIYAGEQIGDIHTMLIKIVDYQKTIILIKNKIKKALFYPLSVLSVAFIIIFILLFYVIPELQNLFADFGKELPAYTRWLMNISTQLRAAGWLIPAGLLLCCGVFYWLKKKNKH